MEIIIKKEKRSSFRLSVRYPHIVAQVPVFATAGSIRSFIASNQQWIELQDKVHQILYPNFLSDDKLLWYGEWLPIIRHEGKNTLVISDAVYVGVHPQASNSVYQKKFTQLQKASLLAIIKESAQKIPMSYNKITIKKLTASHGRCSSQRDLSFSNRLSHYPKEFIDMVVAHEMAHLKELNHSKAFYETLKNLCPNYAAIQKKYRHYLQEVSYD